MEMKPIASSHVSHDGSHHQPHANTHDKSLITLECGVVSIDEPVTMLIPAGICGSFGSDNSSALSSADSSKAAATHKWTTLGDAFLENAVLKYAALAFCIAAPSSSSSSMLYLTISKLWNICLNIFCIVAILVCANVVFLSVDGNWGNDTVTGDSYFFLGIMTIIMLFFVLYSHYYTRRHVQYVQEKLDLQSILSHCKYAFIVGSSLFTFEMLLLIIGSITGRTKAVEGYDRFFFFTFIIINLCNTSAAIVMIISYEMSKIQNQTLLEKAEDKSLTEHDIDLVKYSIAMRHMYCPINIIIVWGALNVLGMAFYIYLAGGSLGFIVTVLISPIMCALIVLYHILRVNDTEEEIRFILGSYKWAHPDILLRRLGIALNLDTKPIRATIFGRRPTSLELYIETFTTLIVGFIAIMAFFFDPFGGRR